ncbi:MAG: sulfotransferase [Phormidesmis sp.]
MALPNFLIFGVQKSGTTSIYSYLKQHPQVYTSPRKETDFFCRDLTQPVPADEPRFTKGGRKRILTVEDYESLFSGVTSERAIGEASPNYLFRHEQAVPGIKAYVPEAKLIAILRNPVERAYSDYLMHVRDVVGNRKPLATQVAVDADSSHTLLKGRYYEGMKHFLEAFGPDQVKVFLYDELRKDAAELMQQLYEFIGVDSTFEVDTGRRQQTAQVPKSQTIQQVLQTNNPLRQVAGSVLRQVMPIEKRQQLRSRLLAANATGKEDLPLSAEDRQLLEDYYRDDVRRLQDLLDRDLSQWFALD